MPQNYIGALHVENIEDLPVTILETETFSAQVKKILNEDQKANLIFTLAAGPTLGDIIKGSGGVRKFRYQITGSGKRGGSRVIYYYKDNDMPLYLVTIYKKSDQSDLSKDDLKLFRKLVNDLVEAFKK